jgi:hypothetical protein
VQTFSTAREAKEFLVSRIVTEAQREGVSLSEIETKMLYFSETHWAPSDFMEVSAVFDRDYDQAEYEQKIAALIRNFRTDARKNNRDELDAWKQAVRTIRNEDHYLLALIGVADGAPAVGEEKSYVASGFRFLKLLAIAVAIFIVLALLVTGYLLIKG